MISSGTPSGVGSSASTWTSRAASTLARSSTCRARSVTRYSRATATRTIAWFTKPRTVVTGRRCAHAEHIGERDADRIDTADAIHPPLGPLCRDNSLHPLVPGRSARSTARVAMCLTRLKMPSPTGVSSNVFRRRPVTSLFESASMIRLSAAISASSASVIWSSVVQPRPNPSGHRRFATRTGEVIKLRAVDRRRSPGAMAQLVATRSHRVGREFDLPSSTDFHSWPTFATTMWSPASACDNGCRVRTSPIRSL